MPQPPRSPGRLRTDLEFPSPGSPQAIACPTAALCVVGDDHGDVLSSTGPAGTALWTGATVDVDKGIARTINGLACPSTTLCIAVDNAGGVLTTDDPTGPATAWTRVAVDPSSSFTAVACASSTYCVAVDKAGVLSSSAPWR